MLLVEGCDNTGKTTVARRLLEHLPGWSYRHFTNPDPFAPPYRYFLWQVADTHPRMVLDRFHLSDWAYGHVYKGGPKLTSHEWRFLELALLALDGRVLLMSDDAEQIRARWGEKEEMYDAGGAEQLVARYHEIAYGEATPRRTRLPVLSGRLDLLDDRRLREVAEWCGDPVPGPPPSLALGSPRASFLVLGEAPPPSAPPSDARGSDPDLPFSRGPAAAWLWRALDELGVRWWEGAYANAASFRSFNEFDDYLCAHRRRGLRKVVCLGERADRLVRDHWRRWGNLTYAALDRHCVWHPSYVKRFRHREFAAWKLDLGAALLPHLDAPQQALESCGWPEGWNVEQEPEWLGAAG